MAGVSSNVLLSAMTTIIRVLEPRSVCDIGAGMGKYGRMIREMNAQGLFQTKLTAVEIDAQYVEQYRLKELYDEVIVADALELLKNPRHRFDLVVIGDCIEHMRKSAGIDLLNFLVYRSGYIAVLYPIEYPQDGPPDHIQEAHISVWSPADFAGMNCLHVTRRQDDTRINLALIKGYVPTDNAILGFSETSMNVNYRGTPGQVPL